jgi:hypothetical protein
MKTLSIILFVHAATLCGGAQKPDSAAPAKAVREGLRKNPVLMTREKPKASGRMLYQIPFSI